MDYFSIVYENIRTYLGAVLAHYFKLDINNDKPVNLLFFKYFIKVLYNYAWAFIIKYRYYDCLFSL